jgi:tetratricopeptide (TPR) repeat protein
MLRQEQGAYQYSTAAMMVLGEILEAEADFSGARHQYEEALGLRRRIGAIELTAETQASLGELALLEHHPEEAESLVRSALPEFEKQKSAPNESGAYVLLSRALRSQGRIADARNAIDLALRLSAHVDAAGKLSATIEDAAVKEASSGSRDDAQRVLAKARQQLSSVIITAKKLGYYRIELEARLVLGQIELKRAPQNGRAGVQQLQKEAHDHGFEQISREADILLKGDGNIVASARQHL